MALIQIWKSALEVVDGSRWFISQRGLSRHAISATPLRPVVKPAQSTQLSYTLAEHDPNNLKGGSPPLGYKICPTSQNIDRIKNTNRYYLKKAARGVSFWYTTPFPPSVLRPVSFESLAFSLLANTTAWENSYSSSNPTSNAPPTNETAPQHRVRPVLLTQVSLKSDYLTEHTFVENV